MGRSVGRQREREDADVSRRAIGRRCAPQRGQELGVVRGVRGVGTGVAAGSNTGSAVERRDLDARVIGQ